MTEHLVIFLDKNAAKAHNLNVFWYLRFWSLRILPEARTGHLEFFCPAPGD
jgi:hypothetical protein